MNVVENSIDKRVDQNEVSILVLLTCYNRCKTTKRCIESLVCGNPGCTFTFVVVDDNSTDGTSEMLECLMKHIHMVVINGTGQLYYSGGMRVAMTYVREEMILDYSYYLLINDDVCFSAGSIENLIRQSVEQNGAVIVGTLTDDSKRVSYGAIKKIRGLRNRLLDIADWETDADTFNANCVLIPPQVFCKTNIMDSHYIHTMGDWDYGFEIKRSGASIHPSRRYVGTCNRNTQAGQWSDKTLSRWERLKRKETPKGLPQRQWVYYLKKNYGIGYAMLYSIVPYIKIILKR